MKKMILAIAVCAALASGGPAFADTIQMNGKLPMYPNAKLDPKEASLTPEVIAQGAPLVILTDDSVAKVDGWYKSHAPKECTRQEASTGVKYACPTGSIMIYSKGQTQIAFVPAFPKF